MTSSLRPGARLGSYEIVAALGAGGMGEVWQARDPRLGRDVALKVLPAEFADDADRLGRFRREAHLLATLNHPNVAAIYGLEEDHGHPFLALELVPGEDLLARMARGPLPLGDALDVAAQIVEALEEAHAKGIVHRDLKPANVKITPEGRVKVLDFGLAKAFAPDVAASGSASSVSQSPTLARSGTLAGVILGTAAYMSPEQASGKAVDRRTDIWAFGVVLFEMITGRPLFTGETASEILASVIKEEPPWVRLPADCPPSIARLLRRCLRKNPRDRLQDIGDARLELAEAREGGFEAEAKGGGSTVSRRRDRWAWAVAFAALAFSGWLALQRMSSKPPMRNAAHFVLDLPPGVRLAPTVPNVPTLSPDGRRIAFPRSTSAAQYPLIVRTLATGESREIPGTEGARSPFWSPDGDSLGFFLSNRVARVDLAGGPVQTICSNPTFFLGAGGTWSRSGTIIFASGGAASKLFMVPAVGGEPQPLHRDPHPNEIHGWPQFLPDERRFLFTVTGSAAEQPGVYISSLDAPQERRRLLPEGTRAYATPGHLLFAREGTLLAQPFDPERAALHGEATPIAASLGRSDRNRNLSWFTASPDGTLAFVTGTSGDIELNWVDRRGTKTGAVGPPGLYGQLALSPDESRVAVEVADGAGGGDLWVIDVARGVSTRITTDAAVELDPVWSPDGTAVVYDAMRSGKRNLYRKSLSSSAPEELLLDTPDEKYAEAFTPDGKSLVYNNQDQGAPRFLKSVWTLPRGEGGKPELVLKNGFDMDEPRFSPDGRWLAYMSDESGQWEVYVAPHGRPGERVRVSVEGGGTPRWRRDGKELFYLSPKGQIMAVPVSLAPGLSVGLPSPLFETSGSYRPEYDDYAPAGDGRRFLVKVPVRQQESAIHVIVNWTSLLSAEAR